MTSLRTQWGLKISDLELRIADLIQQSLKGIDSSHYTLENGVLKLTDEGKDFTEW